MIQKHNTLIINRLHSLKSEFCLKMSHFLRKTVQRKIPPSFQYFSKYIHISIIYKIIEDILYFFIVYFNLWHIICRYYQQNLKMPSFDSGKKIKCSLCNQRWHLLEYHFLFFITPFFIYRQIRLPNPGRLFFKKDYTKFTR